MTTAPAASPPSGTATARTADPAGGQVPVERVGEAPVELELPTVAVLGDMGSVVTRADDTDTVQDLVREIQRLIPQYTGLMERAQANQRVGNPLGVAYMTQASSLMHETMLLKAQVILDTTREQVEDEMNRLTRAQLVPLSGLLAALLVLFGLPRLARPSEEELELERATSLTGEWGIVSARA